MSRVLRMLKFAQGSVAMQALTETLTGGIEIMYILVFSVVALAIFSGGFLHHTNDQQFCVTEERPQCASGERAVLGVGGWSCFKYRVMGWVFERFQK